MNAPAAIPTRVSPDLQQLLDTLSGSLDPGQSEMNDMKTLYAKAAAKRTPLIRVAVSEEEILSGAAFGRFPTGAALVHRARDFAGACRISATLLHPIP